MPYRSVCRADIVDPHAGEFLQCLLHGHAVLAHDVRVVALHLVPINVAVHLAVYVCAVQSAEASEGVAREEHVLCDVERNHRLGPVNHRYHGERQLVCAERERVAVLHFYNLVFLVAHVVVAAHHVERLLVAHDLCVGIILLDECERAAVVGLHVVDDDVVDRTVADDAAHVVYELREEVYFYCVYERYLLVIDDIGVVAYAERQGPETLKECFVAVVDAYWMNVGHVIMMLRW